MIWEMLWLRWWPGILLATGVAVSDYVCTHMSARAYRERASSKVVFEGSFELNPVFQRDIDSGRRLSPRFLLALVGLNVGFLLLWYLTHQPPEWPGAYEFLLGAFVLLQFAIHIRHFRNLYLFHAGFGPDGVQGKLCYPRPLILKLSAVELASFAALYLVLFLATGSWFILGGVVTCFGLSLKHVYLSRRRNAG